VRTALLVCLTLPLGGCGPLRSIGLLPSPPPPTDYLLAITLSATPDINPDASGRASPLRLHVYAGERDPGFGDLGFDAVFGTGAASGTGPTPLDTLVVAPGQSVELALTPDTRAVWVTIAAAYREPWSAIWSESVRVDGSGTARVRVELERATLRLLPGSDR